MHESEKWKWSRSVVSDPQRPHALQPTGLLCPWDFPGKSTGVGCHCLLRVFPYYQPKRKKKVLLISIIELLDKLSRLSNCHFPCSLPGSSVHGILQARILEGFAISFSRESSWPRDRTRVSHTAGRLYHLSHQGSPYCLYSFAFLVMSNNWNRILWCRLQLASLT